MRRHAQMFITDHRGIVEAMGTDQIVPLDARFSLWNSEMQAMAYAKRMANVKTFTHYQIRTGGISNPRNLTGVFATGLGSESPMS